MSNEIMSTSEVVATPNIAEGEPHTEVVADTTNEPKSVTPDVDSMANKAVNAIQPDQRQIFQNVLNLCNTTLYVLTKGMYSGEVSHHVDTAKEFVKEIKKDVESKIKSLPNS